MPACLPGRVGGSGKQPGILYHGDGKHSAVSSTVVGSVGCVAILWGTPQGIVLQLGLRALRVGVGRLLVVLCGSLGGSSWSLELAPRSSVVGVLRPAMQAHLHVGAGCE